MLNLKKLGTISGIVATILAASIALISIGGWVYEVSLAVDKINAIEEQVAETPDHTEEVRKIPAIFERLDGFARRMDGLAERLDRFIGWFFYTLPDEQKTAPRNANPENALE